MTRVCREDECSEEEEGDTAQGDKCSDEGDPFQGHGMDSIRRPVLESMGPRRQPTGRLLAGRLANEEAVYL